MRVLAWSAVVCLGSAAALRAQAVVANTFDAVIIKPAKPEETGRGWDQNENTTKISNFTLVDLVRRAYDLKARSQVLDTPEWTEKDRYDITAKVTPDEMKRMDALPLLEGAEAYRATLRSMLVERFGLKVELSKRVMPRFALMRVSATSMGPGLLPTPAGPDGRAVGGTNTSRDSGSSKATFTVSGVAMRDLADRLSGMNEVGQRVVVDKTGLPGFFQFKLEYAPDNGMGVSPEATMPGLVDAMREQLGLKLVKDEGDVPVVIVSAASKPELD